MIASDLITEKLYCATTMIMEEMCFLFCDPDTGPEKEAAYEARVAFDGPVSGQLILRSDKGMVSAIAANMIGEGEPDARQRSDAYAEFANVLCGNVLPNVGNPKDEFIIRHPIVSEKAGPIDDTSAIRARLKADEGRLEVIVVLS